MDEIECLLVSPVVSQTRILGSPSLAESGYRPRRTLTPAPLAPDSVETNYVSALCALYDDQAVAGLNSHLHPRGKGLKALIERLKID